MPVRRAETSTYARAFNKKYKKFEQSPLPFRFQSVSENQNII